MHSTTHDVDCLCVTVLATHTIRCPLEIPVTYDVPTYLRPVCLLQKDTAHPGTYTEYYIYPSRYQYQLDFNLTYIIGGEVLVGSNYLGKSTLE